METLPIIAGLISAGSALLIFLSLLAYRRTGMVRMLSVAGIGSMLLIKGMLIFMNITGFFRVGYEISASLDLIIVVFLAIMLFGKE